ncbi:glycoside hydrolase family 3 protein [Argonema galeatum]|uniref:glycoside hydrolase family 3 protein n=1 Tax=Argonema galeatum TaxID=2942762 RepID=UPI0023DFC1FB|nr:glycoside hydrolase family 3 N-terminal domain-containing protein [Argonema galeatum]MCL1466345.1 beta-glucosidase [Argonema galeatum A003/A1]
MKSSKLPDLDKLTLAEQVAQMVVVRASGYLFDHQIKYPQWEPPAAKLQHLIANLGVGGVILLGGSAAELALRSQQIQNWAKIPLLIAADIEEGVGQRFSGATWFPPPMAIGAIAQRDLNLAEQYAEQMGAIIAQEAIALGINWVLAPVVDVNNNPDNPVINVRAFGETPAVVSQLAAAFIEGAKRYPVLTTAKHFPGHGDTAVDSHLELPVIPHSPARLAEIELPPFAAAISAGVDTVMTAHLLIPNWDRERPATLSHPILTGQLRENLGFEGLIVTDALVMGAIANEYGTNEAPVLAVEAGADILLMPVDPEGAIAAICDAVTSGRISPDRIRASVERIWQAKLKVFQAGSGGVGEWGSNFILQPLKEIGQPAFLAAPVNILRETTEVFGSVPLQVANLVNLRNLIVVDNLLDCKFIDRQAPAIAIPVQLGYTTQLCDIHTPSASNSDDLQPTLMQVFIRGNPFRGSAGISSVAEDWFKKLLKAGKLQALILYGSPYIKKQFLDLLPSDIPCLYSYGQIYAAQAIALEALFGK